MRSRFHFAIAPFFLLLLAGCGQYIAQYSLEAYKNATSLKAETLALIDKSGDAFASRKDEIEALTTKINVAYEFAAGMPNNQLSAQQWQILRDPDGALYGAFVKFWAQRGRITSPVFRADVKKKIGEAFDEIICLEANKESLKSCSAPASKTGG